ncbi:MAG TPA: SUMF1/EgtB/PvdO family nonheme iron enzyme [Chitinophagales bacterium]|nr:SUMF1/EgtB/PvdO family nonheme iron enzyme [Chitinophagales bacterium]
MLSCENGSKSDTDSIVVKISIKDTSINNMDLVYVPPGVFKSGLASVTDTIKYGYYIGKYEVTNSQFAGFLTSALETGLIYASDSAFVCNYSGDDLVSGGQYRIRSYDNKINYRNGQVYMDSLYRDHPAVSVTWYGAKYFCNMYGFDLPSEREWEKAARGNTDFWYPWGNQIDSTYANYYLSNDPFETGTTPVGFYDGNAHNGFKTHNAISVYGCYDMAGNAWEWTKDYWSCDIPYHTGKGGGYHYHTPAFLQVYYVSCYGPSTFPEIDMNDAADGFRVVLHTQ